jgi:GTP pyrophosphokinase
MDRIYELYPRYDENGHQMIRSAYGIASMALKDHTRSNGNPFIEHPDAVAKIAYEEIGLSAECIAAIYLHEHTWFFPETHITSAKFGKDVYTMEYAKNLLLKKLSERGGV